MTTPIPKPTISQAIADLRDRDSYKVLVEFIRQEREAAFALLGPAVDPHEVMKIAGGIARLDEMIALMSQ
jgi:hypothetical protein